MWASGQCPRTGGPPNTPHPQCLWARGPDQVCLLRAMKGFGFHPVIIVWWGGFTQYLHLSHPQMRLLFLSLSLHDSLYLSLSLFLSPSLFLKCFLFVWSQVSDSLFLRCGFIYPEGCSCLAQRRNTKPTVGDALLLFPPHYCLSPSYVHSLHPAFPHWFVTL